MSYKNFDRKTQSWILSEITKDSKLDFLEKQIKAGLIDRMATMQDMQEFNNLSSLVQMGSNDSDKNALDKKTRREIANSNERRRMQSINTGFLRLKALVPSISKEKVSKVSWKFFKKIRKNPFLQNKILGNNFTTDRRVHWKAGARKETDAPVTSSAKSKFQKFWNYDTTEFWFWKRSKGRNAKHSSGNI